MEAVEGPREEEGSSVIEDPNVTPPLTSEESEDEYEEIRNIGRHRLSGGMMPDGEVTGESQILRGRLLNSSRFHGLLATARRDIYRQSEAIGYVAAKIDTRFNELTREIEKLEKETEMVFNTFRKTLRHELEELVTAAWCRTGDLGIVDISELLDGFSKSFERNQQSSLYPQHVLQPKTETAIVPIRKQQMLPCCNAPLFSFRRILPSALDNLVPLSTTIPGIDRDMTTFVLLHDFSGDTAKEKKLSETTSSLAESDLERLEKTIEAIKPPMCLGFPLDNLNCSENSVDYKEYVRGAAKEQLLLEKAARKKLIGALPGGLSATRLAPPLPPAYPPTGLETESSGEASSEMSYETSSESTSSEANIIKSIFDEEASEQRQLNINLFRYGTKVKRARIPDKSRTEVRRERIVPTSSSLYKNTFTIPATQRDLYLGVERHKVPVENLGPCQVTEYWQLQDHLGDPYWIYRGRRFEDKHHKVTS